MPAPPTAAADPTTRLLALLEIAASTEGTARRDALRAAASTATAEKFLEEKFDKNKRRYCVEKGKGRVPCPPKEGAKKPRQRAAAKPGTAGPARRTAQQVHDHIKGLLAGPAALTADHISQTVELVTSLTVAEQQKLKAALGLKASGKNKSELAQKITERALAKKPAPEPARVTPAPATGKAAGGLRGLSDAEFVRHFNTREPELRRLLWEIEGRAGKALKANAPAAERKAIHDEYIAASNEIGDLVQEQARRFPEIARDWPDEDDGRDAPRSPPVEQSAKSGSGDEAKTRLNGHAEEMHARIDALRRTPGKQLEAIERVRKERAAKDHAYFDSVPGDSVATPEGPSVGDLTRVGRREFKPLGNGKWLVKHASHVELRDEDYVRGHFDGGVIPGHDTAEMVADHAEMRQAQAAKVRSALAGKSVADVAGVVILPDHDAALDTSEGDPKERAKQHRKASGEQAYPLRSEQGKVALWHMLGAARKTKSGDLVKEVSDTLALMYWARGNTLRLVPAGKIRQHAERFAEGGHRLRGVEIFAAGTHRGKTYTERDLDDMVANFERYSTGAKPWLEVPGVLGHEEDQQYLERSDLPAAAWCRRLYRAGSKLKADFDDVPPKVAALLRGRRYKKVSAEVYDEIPQGLPNSGEQSKMLRRVAFLGGEIPQVKSLDDIPLPEPHSDAGTSWRPVTLTLHATSPLPGGCQACFSEVSPMDRQALLDALGQHGFDLAALTDAVPDETLSEFLRVLDAASQEPDGDEPEDLPLDQEPEPADGDELMAEDGDDKDKGDDKKFKDGCAAEYADGGLDLDKPLTDSSIDNPLYTAGGGQGTSPVYAGGTKLASRHPKSVSMKFQERTARIEARLQRAEKFAEQQQAAAKKALVASKLDSLIAAGKVLPAEREGLESLLHSLDADAVTKFAEKGNTVERTAFEQALAVLEARPTLVKFGERVKSARPGTAGKSAQPSEDVEVAEVEAHYEAFSEQFGKAGLTKEKLVEGFKNQRKLHPETTAKQFLSV